MNLNEMAQEIHDTAWDKGFWDDCSTENEDYFLATKLALISSEAAEALDELRNHLDEAYIGELADVIIRALDLARYSTDDIESVVLAKMAKNKDRSHRHGRAF